MFADVVAGNLSGLHLTAHSVQGQWKKLNISVFKRRSVLEFKQIWARGGFNTYCPEVNSSN